MTRNDGNSGPGAETKRDEVPQTGQGVMPFARMTRNLSPRRALGSPPARGTPTLPWTGTTKPPPVPDEKISLPNEWWFLHTVSDR
jgi:hypothetical protein